MPCDSSNPTHDAYLADGVTLDFVSLDEVVIPCSRCDQPTSLVDCGVINESGEGVRRVCSSCNDDYEDCRYCNRQVHSGDAVAVVVFVLGRYRVESACQECADDRSFTCYACDTRFDDSHSNSSEDGDCYCAECYCDRFTHCSDCGCELFSDSEAFYRDGDAYCDGCLPPEDDDEYDDDGDCDCDSCRGARSTILNYSANVLDHCSFLGKPHDGLYIGIENEVSVSCGGSDSDREHAARKVRGILGEDYCIVKHDGSIDFGFEIVSAPATLDIHIDRWNRFFSDRPDKVVAGRNGLHVHVSRDALGWGKKSKRRSELTTAKVVSFINDPANSAALSCFSGRGPGQWCYRHEKPPHRYMDDAGNKYQAVNLLHSKTIEFRVFHSTLNPDRLFGRIEFCAAVCRWARGHASLRELTWEAFVEYAEDHQKTYTNLWKYLGACELLPHLAV